MIQTGSRVVVSDDITVRIAASPNNVLKVYMWELRGMLDTEIRIQTLLVHRE